VKISTNLHKSFDLSELGFQVVQTSSVAAGIRFRKAARIKDIDSWSEMIVQEDSFPVKVKFGSAGSQNR